MSDGNSVQNALINAPASTPDNVLSDEMANLQLPANESLFRPASDWDTVTGEINPTSYLASNAGITNPNASGLAASSSAFNLSGFSIFGLGSVMSIAVVAGLFWLLSPGAVSHSPRPKRL